MPFRRINVLDNYIGALQILVWVSLGLYGLIVTFRLFRLRRQRHKFTKAYFPKDIEDFIDYYATVIRSGKKKIYITSDGFNMDNPTSRARAKKLTTAQEEFLKNGGILVRFQITRSTQINWIPEIAKMKSKYPKTFFTYTNPQYDDVGNFAVIDPLTKDEVYEYMLPRAGYYGQATEPSDFGFVHGHRGKTEKALRKFDEIIDDECTVEISAENYQDIMSRLWEERSKAWETRGQPIIDPEMMKSALLAKGSSLPFNPRAFQESREKV